jgi:transposase-like protein
MGIIKTLAVCSDVAMAQRSTRPTLYKGYRFPPEIISRCVWLYYRFGVSLRDVSELMLARGIEVSHEAIRLWTLRFGREDRASHGRYAGHHHHRVERDKAREEDSEERLTKIRLSRSRFSGRPQFAPA